MLTDFDLKKYIGEFALTISKQQIGLASHQPEEWGMRTRCFENSYSKVQKDGGRVQFGWMFHWRISDNIPGPGYLIAIHHAVWCAPNGQVIDVTPFHHDKKHHPLTDFDNSIIFLVDDNAMPMMTDKVIAPLPSRYYQLNDEQQLTKYVQQLSEIEQEKCRQIYEGLM